MDQHKRMQSQSQERYLKGVTLCTGGRVTQSKVESLKSLQVTEHIWSISNNHSDGEYSDEKSIVCVQGKFDLVVNCAGLGAR